jgi:Carbohydrate family 9 binding domain-like
MMKLLLLWLAVLPLAADGPGLLLSKYIDHDFELSADPASPVWKDASPVFAEKGPKGDPEPEHRTEIRSRWSNTDLYFLFVSPYQTLYLKPNPTANLETNKLWDWDVAEVFIGTDFQNIRRYKEFEVSPQGEWVDLDIDRDHPLAVGIAWNSGFTSKTRIDSDKKIWYCEMRIPIDTVDNRPPEPGLQMRVNLYRIEGAPPHRVFIAWQPTGQATYHVPEAFGRLQLVK